MLCIIKGVIKEKRGGEHGRIPCAHKWEERSVWYHYYRAAGDQIRGLNYEGKLNIV